LLGRLLSLVLGFTLLFLVAVGGYAGYVYFSTGGEPVKVKEVRFVVDPAEVTEEETPITVEAVVFNGFHVGATITGGALEVYFNDVKAADVEIPAQAIGRGDNVVRALVILDNDSLKDMIYTHLAQGEESTVRVKGSISVAVGPLERSINVDVERVFATSLFPSEVEVGKAYEVPGGEVVVESLSLSLAEVTRDYVLVDAALTVYNDTVEPLYVGDLAYAVEHVESGVELASGRVTERVLIAPGERGRIPFTVKVDLDSVKPVWVAHIKNMEKSTVRLTIWVSIELAGLRIDVLRLAPITLESMVETSFFTYTGTG